MRKRKIAKMLQKVGSSVDVSFLVYVNNDEPRKFDSRQSALVFLNDYRKQNTIFNLQIFRIEVYSL